MGRPSLATLTICCLAACRPSSPEAQVRAAFSACVAAIEKGDAAGAAGALAPEFQGPEGMDRATARLYLLGVLRQQQVGVTVLSNQVQVRRDEAVQAVDLILTSKGQGLLPQDAGRRSFILRWRKIQGDWKLRSVEKVGPES